MQSSGGYSIRPRGRGRLVFGPAQQPSAAGDTSRRLRDLVGHDLVEKIAQVLGVLAATQMSHGLGLDLADALAGDVEGRPTSSSVRGVLAAEAVAQLDHLALAVAAGVESRARAFSLCRVSPRARGATRRLVGDEVAELRSSSSPTGFSSETGCCAIA